MNNLNLFNQVSIEEIIRMRIVYFSGLARFSFDIFCYKMLIIASTKHETDCRLKFVSSINVNDT